MSLENYLIEADFPIGSVRPHLLGLRTGATLHRLTRRADGDWLVAPPSYRHQRCDPPEGHKDAYGMLYLAAHRETAAFELGILRMIKSGPKTERLEFIEDAEDPTTGEMPAPCQEVIHTVSSSCFFVDLDHSSVCAQFGESLKTPLDQYETWQKVCLKVYKEIRAQGSALFAPVVGVTFASQHRGTGGRNFAVFEEFRDKVLSRGITRPLDAESLKQAIKRLPV